MDRDRAGSRSPSVPRSAGRERLAAIARMVPRGSRVADIGSGHGGLPLLLLDSGRASHCVAAELDRGSGSDLLRLPRRPDLAVRFGDGLEVLLPEDRIDVLVLAGMGGRSIARILSLGWERWGAGIRRVVLQPQGDAPVARKWLWSHGLALCRERLVSDRSRSYLILAAERGPTTDQARHETLDPEELAEVGPLLLRSGDPAVRSHWERQIRRLERIVGRASEGPGRDAALRGLRRARRIRAVLEEAES